MSLDTPDLQKRLDAMVTDGEMPGAQLSILADGEITSVASGVLNLRTGVPVTTESLFQIGSVSKIWTASAVMRLVDAGAVDLDAPVRTYLPTLQVGDEDTGARVTLRHLLDHTSGIEGDVFDDTGRNDDALDRYLALLADLRPSFALGETWSYCNAGFAIAGRIIADHAGSTFEQAIRDQLAAPLGIERFAWNADEAILHSAAVGHVTDPDSGEIRVTPSYGLPRNAGPAGLVTTTTGDLL